MITVTDRYVWYMPDPEGDILPGWWILEDREYDPPHDGISFDGGLPVSGPYIERDDALWDLTYNPRYNQRKM